MGWGRNCSPCPCGWSWGCSYPQPPCLLPVHILDSLHPESPAAQWLTQHDPQPFPRSGLSPWIPFPSQTMAAVPYPFIVARDTWVAHMVPHEHFFSPWLCNSRLPSSWSDRLLLSRWWLLLSRQLSVRQAEGRAYSSLGFLLCPRATVCFLWETDQSAKCGDRKHTASVGRQKWWQVWPFLLLLLGVADLCLSVADTARHDSPSSQCIYCFLEDSTQSSECCLKWHLSSGLCAGYANAP